jgi:alpha-1,6-mannosyltransferase
VIRSASVEYRVRRSSPAGTRAVAFAAGGIVAMSVMGAARGSPYQPILTPKGQSHGWLRDVASAIGLERLHGDWLLFLSVVVSIVAVAGFLLLLREAFRGNVSVRTVVLLVIGAHVLLLFLPLLFSRDVYSYAFYGRIAGIYHANPYVQTPLDHSNDLLWNYVGPKWIDTPAVYGPAFTSLSALMARVLRTPADHVEAYRFLAIVVSLATCAAIVSLTTRLWPERIAFALVAFGANPVVLFHSVASGHNDLLVALAVAVALAFVVRGRELPAVAVLTLGMLVKATAVLPLALLIVWCVARRAPALRRRTLLTHTGLALGISALFAAPYLQLHDPSLGMLSLAGHEGWLAPAAVLGRILDVVTFGTLGWVARIAFAMALLWLMIALGKEVWRRAATLAPVGLGAAWAWSLVLFTLLGPVLLPWYVVWGLPLVWVLPRTARTALIATSAMMAVTLWSAEPLRFLGGFDLDLFVGHWIVTPVLLVLLVRMILDLRERLSIGMALDDERTPAHVLAVAHHAEGQEAVPAPTG